MVSLVSSPSSAHLASMRRVPSRALPLRLPGRVEGGGGGTVVADAGALNVNGVAGARRAGRIHHLAGDLQFLETARIAGVVLGEHGDGVTGGRRGGNDADGGLQLELLNVADRRAAFAVHHTEVVLVAGLEGRHGHLKGYRGRIVAAHGGDAFP